MSGADDLMDALGHAVKGKVCGVSGCQTDPLATRNGRALCAKHRDQYDHGTMGESCEQCGSRQWTATPDAASIAVCSICDYVTYDEGVLEDSW
jgi:hypothetical protein